MQIRRMLFALALFLGPSYASANMVYTFHADGVTEGYSQQGTAILDFDSSAALLTITLMDNVQPTNSEWSMLTGISFSLTGQPTSMVLESVTPTSVIDCTAGMNPCPEATGSTPYGWGSTFSDGQFLLGAGFTAGPPASFTYQPFGIVNDQYTASGLSDSSLNPLLVGPVTFSIRLTGLAFVPEVNSVSLLFGDPIVTTALAVPEPHALLLVAIGLLAAAFTRRRSTVKSGK